ncbi:phosphate/phosphite/phosphonate ABC transporter substrate-binding protein [Enterococcus hulanensis]|uniref:Phosphate/phosphite/phosphonate ABC transporter substrate-binding protein n=1 Tax=Enterococcus hulanensis TaxID=2559929 RepID=A0ABU3ETR3_9ENTE|nr:MULTISPECIES: phosphate/phosphite/phosphonate ABC transporter substrate-binding protein [Enterococcus]MBO0410283.1 phosphate/phosphite/phosphonate ABC transporter substrate-binding protein [Enterococcus hulanensis]MBO0455582.1 phosphate/phosphite/phosphonate ABC transporter substrate-binding protein [Enterococcus hulanensis]MBX8936846.1 phosphate/phosphite/phosphonate ABC transporter substrate-binding protein [Enterococcus gilvus]MDT2598238.1 phosphate/phosphite/phosphonate ABC transporter s
MQFKQLAKGFIGVMLLTALAGCGSGKTSSSEKDTKEKLVVQFVPTNNDGSMEAKAKPFAKYLSKKLDREVEVTLATDYSTIVEAMSSGQVDVGIMPPAAYVQAKDAKAAEAILTSQLGDYDQETGLPLKDKLTNTFKGEVLVRADSDMTKLTDLKGKNIATLSPNSASGYIYPVAELKDAGVDPTTDAKMTTVNDIPSEITAVLNKQMDAAFVFEGARNVFASGFSDNDLFKDLKVLYLTEGDIPNDAIAVQPDMSKDLKAEIKKTFLNMKDDEDGAEAMSLWGHQGYEEAADSAYDTIRDYTKKAAD